VSGKTLDSLNWNFFVELEFLDAPLGHTGRALGGLGTQLVFLGGRGGEVEGKAGHDYEEQVTSIKLAECLGKGRESGGDDWHARLLTQTARR
jgi:hypothetical protein